MAEGAGRLGGAVRQIHRVPGQKQAGIQLGFRANSICGAEAETIGAAPPGFALLIYGPIPQEGVNILKLTVSLLIYTSQGLAERLNPTALSNVANSVFYYNILQRFVGDALPCFFKALKNPDLNYLTSIHSPFPPLSSLFCFLCLDVFISHSVIPVTSFLLPPSYIFHNFPLFAPARGRFSYAVAISFCDISRLLSGLLLCVKCRSFFMNLL